MANELSTVSMLNQIASWVNNKTVYDVSAHNSGATFASLQELLSASNLNTLIPPTVRHGGMVISFVHSVGNNNNYVQFLYTPDDAATVATFTNVANWQGVDDEPKRNSNNIAKSSGTEAQITELSKKLENEVKYFSLVQISNFVSDKFISANGNLGTLGGASVYYLPYTPNALYKLRYNNAFTTGVMYSWAIYSVNNISDVSAANVVAIGPSTVSLALDECEICSPNTKAKLLCITQYTSRNIILSGQNSSVKEKISNINGVDEKPKRNSLNIVKSGGTEAQIRFVRQKAEDESKYFSVLSVSDFIADKFISANGALENLGGGRVYYLPYTVGALYKMQYSDVFGHGVMYSWAIYNVDDVANIDATNVVAVGPLATSIGSNVEQICSCDESAKLLCIFCTTNITFTLLGSIASVKEKFDSFSIEAQRELCEVNDNILYCTKTQVNNYIDGKFLYENGNLGNNVGAKVYYLPYTPGTLYKLNYTVATTSGVMCSWAIYNTNDTSKLNSSTLVVAGPKISTIGTNIVNIYSLDPSAKLLCITKQSNRNLNIQVESSNVKDKIQGLENINESVQEYIIGIEDEISIFSPIQVSNYLDNRYINNSGNILELGTAKVYYMPYTPGQIFKLNYLTAMTAGVLYSWAIYSVENVEDANSDNCLAIGPRIVNLGTDVSTILSLDSQAKLLCISWYPNYNFVIKGKSETSLVDLIVSSGKSVRYSILNDEVYLAYPYGDVDLLVTLNKRGPNELFDFTGINTIPANSVDIRTAQRTAIQGIGTDYHVAFMVRAINNADGDNKTGSDFNTYFTGGNHGYDNTGSLENNTATARMLSLEFYADGRKVVSGAEGTAEQFKMVWKNNIQGYNTTKQDGSGREILQEIHEMTYENGIFTDTVELIPLEDVYMELCYGFGIRLSHYVNYYFVGGNDRVVHNNEQSYSGTKTTNAIVSYGNLGVQELFIDSFYDIGDRKMLNGENNGAHATTIKAYMNVIKNANMLANAHYSFRGGWIFKPKP